jgi:hypothetical protein
MKGLFWTGLGVAVGVIATRKTARAIEQFTPSGLSESLADSITGLGDAIRQFGMDVREAMWDREDELRDALGLGENFQDTEDAPAR